VLQKIKENAATIYAGVTELRNNFKRSQISDSLRVIFRALHII
jgi:hypothetical protein